MRSKTSLRGRQVDAALNVPWLQSAGVHAVVNACVVDRDVLKHAPAHADYLLGRPPRQASGPERVHCARDELCAHGVRT